MDEDTLKRQWSQLKGRIREKWGRLTDDDLDQIHGQAAQLVGRVQERYGPTCLLQCSARPLKPVEP